MERGEGARIAPLAALFFVLAAGYQLGQAAAYALFVQRFGRGDLPLAFLMMPLVGVALTTAVTMAARRLAPLTVLAVQLCMLAVVAVGLRVGIDAELAAVLFLLPVWDAATNSLQNMIVWSVSARLLDVRQTKRLGALVAAGRSAGLVVAGLAAPTIVASVGIANLYVVQFGAVVLAAAVLAMIARAHPLAFGTGRVASAAVPAPRDEADRSRRFVRSILATVGLTMLGYVVIRNIFLDRAAVQFPSAADYAGAIGLVGAIHGFCTLAASLLFAGRFMVRFGVRGALVSFPLGVLAVYVPFAVLGVVGASDLSLFLIAASGYSLGGVLMYGLRTPALQVLYQPLVPGLRSKVAAAADGVVEPVAVGLAAVALLGITRIVDSAATGMAFTLVAVAVVLLAAVARVSRRYVESMRDAVHRRVLRSGSLDLGDRTTVDAIGRGLSGADPVEIVGLLAGLDAAVVGQVAVRLLDHSSPDVRRVALARLHDDDVPRHAERIARHDADPAVRAAALARLGAAAPADLVLVALADDAAVVQRAACSVGLTERAATEVRAAADRRLAVLAGSEATEDRRVAARLLDPARASELLDALSGDPSPVVRAEARRTSCRAGKPDVVAGAVAALATDASAVSAVVAGRDHSIDSLAALLRRGGLGATARHRAVRCLRRIGTERAVDCLRDATTAADPLLRGDALAAFSAAGGAFTSSDISTRVALEVEDAARQLRRAALLRTAASVGDEAAARLALALVEERVVAGRDRALLVLACGPGRATMRRIRDQLGAEPHRRANAIELLDASLGSDLRRLVLPLVVGDPTDPAAMLRTLHSPPVPVAGAGVGPSRADDGLGGADPLLATVIRRAIGPSSPSGEREPGRDTEVPMSVIERLVVLAGVEPFTGLPGDVLAEVAELVEVVHVDAGSQLFAEGEPGTSMFVVVTGQFRVHLGEQVIDRPGPREVLGELALLDGEPRSASVTAETDAVLYRLDAEPFFELLSERPDMLRAILRTVIGRLRARTADVAALRDQLDGRGPLSGPATGTTTPAQS